jgi:cation transport ATPase
MPFPPLTPRATAYAAAAAATLAGAVPAWRDADYAGLASGAAALCVLHGGRALNARLAAKIPSSGETTEPHTALSALAERMRRYYAPSLCLLSLATLGGWGYFGGGGTDAVLYAASVPLAACPYAFGACPAVYRAALSRLAAAGMRVRRAALLERFRLVDTLLFGKAALAREDAPFVVAALEGRGVRAVLPEDGETAAEGTFCGAVGDDDSVFKKASCSIRIAPDAHAAGTEADATLAGASLRPVLSLMEESEHAAKTARRNVTFLALYHGLALPAATAGTLSPHAAALLAAGAMLAVTINSLRAPKRRL